MQQQHKQAKEVHSNVIYIHLYHPGIAKTPLRFSRKTNRTVAQTHLQTFNVTSLFRICASPYAAAFSSPPPQAITHTRTYTHTSLAAERNYCEILIRQASLLLGIYNSNEETDSPDKIFMRILLQLFPPSSLFTSYLVGVLLK